MWENLNREDINLKRLNWEDQGNQLWTDGRNEARVGMESHGRLPFGGHLIDRGQGRQSPVPFS